MSNLISTLNSTFLGPLSSFVLGLIFGSFANVCIQRLPEDEPIGFTRSRCLQCQTPIPWYLNIPIFSYLWLRGKCRFCHKPFSIQYPLVELTSGLLFLWAFLWFGWGIPFVSYSLFLFLLLTISVIDYHHRIIPDELSLSGIVLGILFSLICDDILWWESLLGIGLGGGIFFIVAYTYEKITKREGLGGGDIKLLAMIGAWLGHQSILIVVVLSTGLGSLIGISLMLFKKKDMKTAIPFGPFLALAALVYLFWKDFFLRLLFPAFS